MMNGTKCMCVWMWMYDGVDDAQGDSDDKTWEHK